jgi:hypothetical protein
MRHVGSALNWRKGKDQEPASVLAEHAGTQPRGENPMQSVSHEDVGLSAPPQLGDLTTRQLLTALMVCWAAGFSGDASAVLPGRGVTVADLRGEVQRRERCDAPVAP